jgi:flagellar motor switch protein FliM
MLDHVENISLVDLLAASSTPKLRSVLLDGLADRCMRDIRLALFELMRNPVQIIGYTNVVCSFDTALAELPGIILASVVQVAPINTRMLVIIEGNLVGAVVDGMCGASEPAPFLRDELSAMEMRIGKQMIELTLTTIKTVLSTLTPVSLTTIQYESALAMLSIADGRDWMFVAKGIIETATGTGTITVMCPYTAFDGMESTVIAHSGLFGQRATDERWETALAGLAENVTVELRLEIARTGVPIGLVEAIRPGQMLPCLLLQDGVGVIDGVEMFHADYGESDGFICCRPKAAVRPAGHAARPYEKDSPMHEVDKERVELEKLQPLALTGAAIANKTMVERVPVMLTVELGRTSISIKDLRLLKQGQIIVLDQMVGEPLSIFANGHRLAVGEVVAVAKDQYGVRVTALAEETPEPRQDSIA